MSTTDTHADTHRLRPFWGRILVLPSPVDESERPSGLIVPMGEGDFGNPKIKRGIVLHMDPWRGEPTNSSDDIVAGTVVYYTGGAQVLDAVVLERTEILAYEVAE